MRIRALAVFLAMPGFGIGAAFAQNQTLPEDTVESVAGVDTLCTGTTMQSRDVWSTREFALRLEFVGKSGQYLGDENVTVTGRNFNSAFHCLGPWVMMDLPAGTYHVNATVADAGTQEFDITLGANARRVRVVRYESAGGISAPSERQASSDDEVATTTRMNRNNAAESGALTAQYVTLKKQYDALSKAVADQSAVLRDHRQMFDQLSGRHDDLRDQARALEQQCNGLQAEFQALQRRRTEQRSWTPSQTQSYMEAQNAYAAKQSQCDERNRGIAAEQAQYDMQLATLRGLIAMDVAENDRLTMRLRQAKADIDSYLAMQR